MTDWRHQLQRLNAKTPISTAFLDDLKGDISKELSLHRDIVFVVILVTVGLWVTTSLHGIKVASVCAVPLVVLTVTGVLSGKDVQGLPWDTLLLVAGGLSLGVSLEHTGLLQHYAKMLIALQLNSLLLLSMFGFLAMILANSTSALLLLASSPSNAIVFNTGYLEQKDFRLTGILFGLLGPSLTILWVLFTT